ncbi:hypothetical protein [Actinoplanes sp. NPDC051411]|uniref:hypothetical protein n=1 Tax=Actinoplanes sp. NPDC051411 TaxID=3155522 RepID=UPI00341D1A2E
MPPREVPSPGAEPGAPLHGPPRDAPPSTAGGFGAERPGEIGPAVTPKEVRPPPTGVAGPNWGGLCARAPSSWPAGVAGRDSSAGVSGRAAPSWAAATRGPNQVDAVVPGVGLASGTGSCTGGRR